MDIENSYVSNYKIFTHPTYHTAFITNYQQYSIKDLQLLYYFNYV